MDIKQVDLTVKNPALGRLQAKTLEKAYTVVPDRVLPVELKTQLNAIKAAVGLGAITDETVTFVIQGVKNEGAFSFKRLFQPKVYKTTDENGKQSLVLKWGNELCHMKALKSNIEIPSIEGFAGVSKDSESCALTITTAGSDQYIDVLLKVTVETPEGSYLYAEFPFATADDVKGAELKTAFDLNIGKALDLIRELPEALEESKTVDLIELTPGTYSIVGYKCFGGEYGPSVVLKMAAAPELGQDTPFSCFAKKYAQTFLSNPVVTPSNPAELVYFATVPKTGKQKKDQPSYTVTLPSQPDDGSYVSLDF